MIVQRPSLCRGRRVYGQDYQFDCDWLLCPILNSDDWCFFRLSDDDPNPDDEPPPAEARGPRMTNDISRTDTDVIGPYVAEFNFRITPDARMSEAAIRELFRTEAENVIQIIRERAPHVLRGDA